MRRKELFYYVTWGSNVTRDVHWCVTVDYQQIANGNIANQIHGFAINYGKFILILIKLRWPKKKIFNLFCFDPYILMSNEKTDENHAWFWYVIQSTSGFHLCFHWVSKHMHVTNLAIFYWLSSLWNRGYYTVVKRYDFYVRVTRAIGSLSTNVFEPRTSTGSPDFSSLMRISPFSFRKSSCKC